MLRRVSPFLVFCFLSRFLQWRPVTLVPWIAHNYWAG